MIRYQIKIHKEGKGYWGEFPDLSGCFTQGDTKKELLQNAREALSLHLEEARNPKWNVPTAKKRSGSQYAWVTPFEDVAIPLMIRTARLKHGLSQNQLAKLVGITVQQLQKLETPGKSNPTVKTLAAISEALDEELEIQIAA